jgi:transcriptional regulator with XRE-family HTH domain
VDEKTKPWYNENREYENLINEIRVEQGLTLRELGSKLEMSSQNLWYVAQGYAGPYNRSGKLKVWAVKLQQIFGYELSEIFPREVCSLETSNLTNDQLTYIAQGYEGDYYTDIETKFDRCALAALVRKGINDCLTKREKKILNLRFDENQTLDQIGKVIHLSRDRVRQLEARSLRILRGYISRVNNNSSLYERYYSERMRELKRKRELLTRKREEDLAEEERQKQLAICWAQVTL